WHALRRRDERIGFVRAVGVALVASAIIELVQALQVSGVAQGASLAARAVGMAAGLMSAARLPRVIHALLQARALPIFIGVAALVYAVVLVVATGLHRTAPIDFTAATARLAELRWLPFYYHY